MGSRLAPMCRIGGRERINVTDEHFALSAPRQTTAPVTAERGFDLALAAAILTDAAARAGAAIMAHYQERAPVKLKDDLSPVTRADHDSEAIILGALDRLWPALLAFDVASLARLEPGGPGAAGGRHWADNGSLHGLA